MKLIRWYGIIFVILGIFDIIEFENLYKPNRPIVAYSLC